MYTTFALSSLLLAVPAALAQTTGTGSCTDVHIFIARGWNEPYPGRQGTFTSDVCADLPDKTCDYEDIVYDAASSNYCPSVLTGETNGIQQIQDYYARCPDSTLVLSGYSEGANIIGDILAGGTCGLFYGLSQTSGPSCNIAAALMVGDPHHMPNQPYNYLNGTAGQGEGGARDESQSAILNSYTPRLRSYCQYDDLVCATGLGADTVDAHTNYYDYYSEDMASWVAGLVNSFSKDQYCSSTTSTSSAVSTTTSSPSTTSIATSSSVVTSSPAVSSPSSSSAVATSSSVVISSASSSAASSAATVSSNSTITTCSEESSSAGPTTSASPSPATITFWSTKEITITSCAATVTDCPARSTVKATTVVPAATTVITPSAVATLVSAPSASSTPAVSTTTLGGKPAVISYSTTVSCTTFWNFPTISMTKTYPVATSYVGGGSWSNGTIPTGTGAGVASSTGAGVWTSATLSASASPSAGAYTGAASNVKAAGLFAGVAGAVGMMML